MTRALTDGLGGVAFSPEGKLVYTSDVGEVSGLWMAGLEGADRGPLFALPGGGQTGFPSVADDGTVFFAVRGRAGVEIHALDRGGSTSRVVARDALFGPFEVSRDGRFLVYTALQKGVPRLVRVASDGSNPRPVFDGPAYRPALHPSGTRVAFYFADSAEKSRLGICSVEGGPLLLDVPIEPPGPSSRLVLRDEGVYLNTVPGDRSERLAPARRGRPGAEADGLGRSAPLRLRRLPRRLDPRGGSWPAPARRAADHGIRFDRVAPKVIRQDRGADDRGESTPAPSSGTIGARSPSCPKQ